MTSVLSILNDGGHLQWERAVTEYNTVISRDEQERVEKMSRDDLVSDSLRHNTPSGERQGVQRLMNQWDGFNGMLLSEGIVKHDSSLFYRLLNKKAPLPHRPPRSFGKTWYAIFDENTGFESAVSFHGVGRRNSDLNKNVLLLLVNDCLWECCSGSEPGMQLLDIAQIWANAPASERTSLWSRVQVLLTQEISFELRYGRREKHFILTLSPTADGENIQTSIAELPIPTSDNLFGLTCAESGFPFFWKLQCCDAWS